MNPLTALPPEFRRAAYLVYAFVGIALGATKVGIEAADAGVPVWLNVAFAVYAFLGTAFGLTAASNITPRP